MWEVCVQTPAQICPAGVTLIIYQSIARVTCTFLRRPCPLCEQRWEPKMTEWLCSRIAGE